MSFDSDGAHDTSETHGEAEKECSNVARCQTVKQKENKPENRQTAAKENCRFQPETVVNAAKKFLL